jgi:hypothetical protein
LALAGKAGAKGLRSLALSTPPITWWHALDGSDDEPMSGSMTTPNRKALDVEAILNDLYASEINASISWIWDGGFHVILGNPPLAEGWAAVPTIRDAILWLRDKACEQFPNSDFARKYGGFV